MNAQAVRPMIVRARTTRTAILLALLAGAAVQPVLADPTPRPPSGSAVGLCPDPDPTKPAPTNIKFRFCPTDKDGLCIDAPDWPKEVPALRIQGTGTMGALCHIRRFIQPAIGGEPIEAFDYTDEQLVDGKLVASLNVESVHFAGGAYSLSNYLDAVADRVGIDMPVTFPMLSAGGDVALYSLVDVNRYLDAVPAFSLGGSVSVTDGSVPGWAGFMVSSTPFTFAADTGWTGTPWTGDARVSASDTIRADPVPAPGPLLLLGTAFAAIRRRRA